MSRDRETGPGHVPAVPLGDTGRARGSPRGLRVHCCSCGRLCSWRPSAPPPRVPCSLSESAQVPWSLLGSLRAPPRAGLPSESLGLHRPQCGGRSAVPVWDAPTHELRAPEVV